MRVQEKSYIFDECIKSLFFSLEKKVLFIYNWIPILKGPRTNNDIEGYNLKLKNHVSRAHPDIYKSIQVFQTQETAAFVKLKHALDGKPAPPRKKLNIGRDNEIKIYKKLLREGNINIDVYVNNLLLFF
ncbi:unnamed protein product [Brachionus calyciflorus]|uniref:Uncharacterized protein n=1 Tax=Brachionus calyciflorus TaxID=104777 RepID=A0A814Q4N5_9BILA|nr:unnamed protein product [Brachionus calyciflorus]